MIFTNGYVALTTSTQDISGLVTRLRLNRTFDEHDDTRMGLTDHSRVPGLGSWSFDIEAIQTFESTGSAFYSTGLETSLDAILALKVGASAFTVAARPVNAARSSDNPEYRGSVRLFEYSPLDGQVGDLLKTPVRLLSAGSLTRITSSS
jgi:hypothetical protein